LSHPTGTVDVVIDESGEPDFRVNPGSAWDHLEWTDEWLKLSHSTDGVCFGTLGQREVQARETIHRFLEHTPPGALRLFDVNLRHAFFTTELLVQSLRFSTVVKLNNHELMQVAKMLNIASTDALSVARTLLQSFDLDLLAVTRGSRGSLLVTSTDSFEHAGFQAEVVDTIGAGDSFAAALAYAWMQNAPLDITSEVANRVGAWLVTQRGATPSPDKQFLESIRGLLE
jgi:fructokinase